jgi:hypothetical protein
LNLPAARILGKLGCHFTIAQLFYHHVADPSAAKGRRWPLTGHVSLPGCKNIQTIQRMPNPTTFFLQHVHRAGF